MTNITTTAVTSWLQLQTADDAMHMFQEAAGAYRDVAAQLDETKRVAAWADVRDALAQFDTPDGLEAELELLIGAGSRPA